MTFFSAYSQSVFESEADVLFYLNNKANFTNKKNGVTLMFSEMGGRMRSNKGLNYFNPDVTFLTRTRAIVVYKSLTSGGSAMMIVDCKENVVADKSDMTIYSADSNEDYGNSGNYGNENKSAKDIDKPNYIIINGVTKIPNSFVGKFLQGNNYVIITKTSDKKGSISGSYNGKKFMAPFNPNGYLNQNHIKFFNDVVHFYLFGINNNSNIIKEIDLRIIYSDDWSTDRHEDAKKIRFRRQ